MNYSWYIILLGILISYIYEYTPIYTSLILILITKVVYDINIFSSVEFKNGNIQECKVYYEEYKGNLADIQEKVNELKNLIRHFQLSKEKVYRVFTLYVLSVNGPEKIFKNVYVGIMRYKKTGYIEVNIPKETLDKEIKLEEYLFENRYCLVELPKTKSIWSNFILRSEFSIFNILKKYYNKLNKKIQTGLPEELNKEIELSKSFIIMEIYSDSDINFHIPIDNLTLFCLDSSKTN
jgi:hypothetical protein